MNKKNLIAGLLVSVILLIPINSAYSNNGLSVNNNDENLPYDTMLDDIWTKQYHFSADNRGESVKQASIGGYIAVANWASAGSHVKLGSCIFKTNNNGEIIWEEEYGDDYFEPYRVYSVTEDNSGNYCIMTGNFGVKMWIVKYNIIGSKIWEKQLQIYHFARGKEIIPTFDDGLAIVGYNTYNYPSDNQSVLLLKIDNDGNEIWHKTFDYELYNYGYSLKQTSDGGFIIVGYTSPNYDNEYKTYLLKTDENGTLLWEKTFSGNGKSKGYSLDITNDNGYIITGKTNLNAGDIWLLKTDENGTLLWEKTFGGKYNDIGYSVQTTDDGGYIITGYIGDYWLGDVWLIKTDAYGNLQWDKNFGGWSGASVSQTLDSGYILTGEGVGGAAFLIKTDANGNAPPLSKTKDIGIRNRVFDNSFLLSILEQYPLIQKLLNLLRK